MPTNTYTPLATVTLTGADSSVTFASIPATYRDLILVVAGSDSGSGFHQVRFNGDTGSNYAFVLIQNYPSGGNNIESLAYSGETSINVAWQANLGTAGVQTVQIMDYSATDKHKTVLSRGNKQGSNVAAHAGRWANTAAITSVTFLADSMATGTTLSLYGVIA
jgi:hypothetical protein